jgi:hypothetical protein
MFLGRVLINPALRVTRSHCPLRRIVGMISRPSVAVPEFVPHQGGTGIARALFDVDMALAEVVEGKRTGFRRVLAVEAELHRRHLIDR